MSARPELRALTAMRGIAAWAVVLYHLRRSIAGLPPGVERVFSHGYLAVDFFFLLSGFVIWLTWHDRLRAPGAVPRFLLRRVARIWPLHLAMLAATIALATLLALTGRADPLRYPWEQLPLHVLLLQNWGFTDRLAWNDPAWSISAEVAAYLLFPVLVLAVDWRARATATLWATVAALAAALWWIMREPGWLGADIARFGLVRCLAEFAIGTIVAALWMRGTGRALPVAVAAGALAGRWLGVPEPLAIPVAFAALLLLLARSAGRNGHLLEGRAIHYLGAISYATYLSHRVIWDWFKIGLVSDAGSVPAPLIGLYLLLVLGLSVVLHEMLERPAQAWLRGVRLPFRPARRPAPPPAPR